MAPRADTDSEESRNLCILT